MSLKLRHLLALTILTALAATGLSCSLILPFEACETEADCIIPGHVCTEDKLCGLCRFDTECPQGESCLGGVCEPGCASSDECEDGLGCVAGVCQTCGEDAHCAGDLLCLDSLCAAGCTEDSQCDSGQICVDNACGACTEDAQCGTGEVCASGACTALLTPQCAETYGPFDDPAALRLGVLFSLSGISRESGLNPLQAIKIAVDEINDKGGLARPDGGNKKLALLICDDAGDAAQGIEGARHLTEVARVPAFFGPAQSRMVLAVSDTVIGAGAVLMSPSATSVDITGLQDDNLIWRTSPPDRFQADTLAYYAVWQLLERKVGSVVPAVLTLNSNDSYGQSFVTGFSASVDARIAARDLTVTIEAAPYDVNSPESIAQATETLANTEAEVILMVGFEETSQIMAAVKTNPALKNAAFFMSDGTQSDTLRLLFTPQDKPDFFFGSIPSGRAGPIFESFAAKYQAGGQGEPPIWTENAYDSVYLMAYAISGVQGEVTGAAIATQLGRLSDPAGTNITVGPDDLLAAYTFMAQGSAINVTGASGPLDFDGEVGDVLTAEIGRWDIDPNTNAFIDCGTASRYLQTPPAERLWCNAICNPNLGEEDTDLCLPLDVP